VLHNNKHKETLQHKFLFAYFFFTTNKFSSSGGSLLKYDACLLVMALETRKKCLQRSGSPYPQNTFRSTFPRSVPGAGHRAQGTAQGTGHKAHHNWGRRVSSQNRMAGRLLKGGSELEKKQEIKKR